MACSSFSLSQALLRPVKIGLQQDILDVVGYDVDVIVKDVHGCELATYLCLKYLCYHWIFQFLQVNSNATILRDALA